MGYYKNLLILAAEGDRAAIATVNRIRGEESWRKDQTMKPVGTNEKDFIQEALEQDQYSSAIIAGGETLFETINGHPKEH